MKKKFEANVAAELPKTKLHEPELPWKVTTDDLEKIAPEENEFKLAMEGIAPLKVRPLFLITLVMAVFVFTIYMIASAIVENESMRKNISAKEKQILAMKADLGKAAGEKELLAKNSSQLEKKVGELSAQKELFTGVIESLTKKSEEGEVDRAPAEQAAAPAKTAN